MKKRFLFFGGIFLFLQVLSSCVGFAFDGISYDISFSFNETANGFSGREELFFHSDEVLDEIHLHFYPGHQWSNKEIASYKKYAQYFNIENPFPNGFRQNRASVFDVMVNGKPAKARLSGEDNTILIVRPDEPVSGDINVSVGFSFFVPGRIGRFGRKNGVYSIYRAYPILDVRKDGKWLDYPDYLLYQPYISESALYSVSIDVPKEYKVIHSADTVSVSGRAGRKLLKLSSEIPLRDFSFFMSRKYEKFTKEYDGIDVDVFYLPSADLDVVTQIWGYIRDSLDFYRRKGFVYPYKRISVAPVYLGYGGNETSNVVMIDRRVFFIPSVAKRYREFLVVHEFGHQFWFNQVGSDEFAEPFMDEGVNSYFVQKYFIEKYSDPCYVLEWPKSLSWLLPNFTFSDGAILRYRYLARRGLDFPLFMETRHMKEPDMVFAFAYGKGEALLESVERKIGKENMFAGFRKYMSEYKFKIASLPGLISALSDVGGGIDVKSVFDIYTSPRKVDLSIRNLGDDMLEVRDRYKVLDKAKVLACNGGDCRRMSVNCREPFKADFAWVDPDDEEIEIDEANNIWPKWRSLLFKVSPVNLPFYSMDIFNPQDRVSVKAGFSISEFGPGLRADMHYPFVFDAVAGAYFNPGEDERTFAGSIKRYAIFGSPWDLELEYAYVDDYSDYDENSQDIRLGISLPLEPPSIRPGKISDYISVYFAHNREWFSPIDGMFDKNRPQAYYDILDISYIGVSAKHRLSDFLAVDGFCESGLDALSSGFSFNRVRVDFVFDSAFSDFDLRARAGVGISDADDKPMFFIGGDNGLRAYRRKSVRGGNMAIFSMEAFKRVFEVDDSMVRQNGYLSVSAVKFGGFFDVGSVWQDSLSGVKWKKDIGLGLRVGLNIGGLAGSGELRIDLSRSIGEDKEKTRVFVGFGEAF